MGVLRCPGLRGPREQTRLRPVLCLRLPQDLFFKYTWNNFLHFQVELCIAAILAHAACEASAPGSGLQPPPGDGGPETPQPAAGHPDNTMVTHVSPASVPHAAACQGTTSPSRPVTLVLTGHLRAAPPHPQRFLVSSARAWGALPPLYPPAGSQGRVCRAVLAQTASPRRPQRAEQGLERVSLMRKHQHESHT